MGTVYVSVKTQTNMKQRAVFNMFVHAIRAVEQETQAPPKKRQDRVYFLIDEWLAYSQDTSQYDVDQGFLSNWNLPALPAPLYKEGCYI